MLFRSYNAMVEKGYNPVNQIVGYIMSGDPTYITSFKGARSLIMKVEQANADGIRFLKEAGADEAVLTMKSLEAFAKAADGKATKIIIPSEIQSIAGLVKSVTEIGADDKKEEK